MPAACYFLVNGGVLYAQETGNSFFESLLHTRKFIGWYVNTVLVYLVHCMTTYTLYER